MPSANIVLTHQCVGSCPYCFASHTADRQLRPDLSFGEFEIYLDLLASSGQHIVRLLGGEPFLHPEIEKMISNVLSDDRFEHLTIFTSGFVPSKYVALLADKRINLVVNLNESRDYSSAGGYEELVRKLESLANVGIVMTIGFNIFRLDFDPAYPGSMAERLGATGVRWSIAVPAVDHSNTCLDISVKKEVVPHLLSMLQDCVTRNLVPVMDCPPEPCLFDPDQLAEFARLCPEEVRRLGRCTPVIDLLPNGEAYRCFAAGEASRVDISSFHDLDALRKHFSDTIDCGRRWACHESCRDCHYWQRGQCQGGCISENNTRLQKIRQVLSDLKTTLEHCKSLSSTNQLDEAETLLRSQMERAFLPELAAELAGVLLKAQRTNEFCQFMNQYRTELTYSGMQCVDYLWARYWMQVGDNKKAIGFLRRSIREILPERRGHVQDLLQAIDGDGIELDFKETK